MSLTMPASQPDQELSFLEEMVFDHDELFDRLGGDQELLVEVLSSFLIDLPVISESFSGALSSADMESIRSAAHKFKGAVINVSFKQLGELTRLIENAARESDVSRVEDLSQHLAQAIDNAHGQILRHLGPAVNPAG